jgi:hypothetical protein
MFGEESTRNVLVKNSHCVVAFFGAHQLGRLECETRVNVTFRRINCKSDFLAETLKPRANLRPVLRWKRFRCPLRRRLRMNLKWKPTQISLEPFRRLFGPDRAEVTKGSNNVGPDVDDATHKYVTLAPNVTAEYIRREPSRIDGKRESVDERFNRTLLMRFTLRVSTRTVEIRFRREWSRRESSDIDKARRGE